MSEFPSVPLSGVATVRSGYAFKSSDWQTRGVPVIKIANIHPGTVDLAGCGYVSESIAHAARAYQSHKGDPLIAMSGASVGEIGRVRFSEPALVNQRVGIFRVQDDTQLDADFLYHFLQLPETIDFFVSAAYGSAQPNISPSLILSVEVPLPPLAEQRAIATVLGGLDDKIAANAELAATAGELAGSIYELSAARFDARPMSDVLTPVLGGTPARSRVDFWGGDQLWASAKDITGAQFGVVLSTDEKITEAAVAGTKAKPLPAGSVILTARGTVGAVARLAAPASFNQSCYGFVPGDIPPSVLYFAVTRAMLRAKEIAHGSVFDTITMKTFDHLPFPDFDSEALTVTESEVGPLLETVAAMVRENRSLAATRDALLPQLMSGKLRIKDAERALEDAGV